MFFGLALPQRACIGLGIWLWRDRFLHRHPVIVCILAFVGMLACLFM